MKKFLKLFSILLFPIFLCGCATIVSGRSQKVFIGSDPDNAAVTVNESQYKTPCTILLDRTVPEYRILIEKEGYLPYKVIVNRTTNGWVFGNIIFGGIIGVVIDVVSGSCYSFSVDKIDAALIPSGSIVLKEK